MKRLITFLLVASFLFVAATRARAEDGNGIEMLPDDPITNEPPPAPPLEAPPDPASAEPPAPATARQAPPEVPKDAYHYEYKPDRRARNPKLVPHGHFWLAYFELGALGAVHTSGGGYVVGPFAAWRPMIPIGPRVQIRGTLLFTLLKNSDPTPQNFTVTSFEGSVAIGIDHGFLELGGGIQNWSGDNGGSHPVASALIAAPFKRDYLGFLDRIVLGAKMYFGDVKVVEPLLGLGIAF